MPRKTLRADDLVWIIAEEDLSEETLTVGRFLDEKKLARKAMKVLFEEKLVLVNGHKANPKTELQVGDELRLQIPKEKVDHTPRAILNKQGIEEELKVLYEDDDLLILDKPAGITVNSPEQISMANAVALYFKEHDIKRKVRFLNRLDRDTSGCLVIAKSALAQGFYQQQIEHDIFEKYYTMFVLGDLKEAKLAREGTLELPMSKDEQGLGYKVSPKGKMTRTGYRVVGLHQMVFEGKKHILSELEIRLFTGKTHQIRVAFAHYGHPLAGDLLYGGAIPDGVEFADTVNSEIVKALQKSFYLRSKKVVFTSLRSGERITVTA